MESKLQEHSVDLDNPHLTLGSHNKFALHQMARIIHGVQDSAPDRQDVRGITIDGATSLDLDDAVWVERSKNGYCVWIHISDVSEYIPIFSPLDIEALHRTTSIYRRDIIHNMFPPELANGILSLDPNGGQKLTCTLQIDVNQDGDVTNHQFFESCFTNLRRYTHESFGEDFVSPESEHYSMIHLLNELSTKLRMKRLSQGGMLHFGDDDRRLILDNSARKKKGTSPAAKLSHDIIESLMVLANTTIGNHLVQNPGAPGLFRRHDVLNESSFYYHKPCRHDGLKVQNYTHFTSPIRRYVDIVVHRVLKALSRGDEIPYTPFDIQFITAHVNNVRLLVDTFGSQIDREAKGDEFMEKMEGRLGRPPLVCDMKMKIKDATSRSHRLPRAILQAISDNIDSKPRDTWIWAVGVILLSQETDLKKLLKEKILNHTGIRVRGFLNVLGQTRITLGEDALFGIEEYEKDGKYTLKISCKGEYVVENSCDVRGEDIQRDLPHQCRREAVGKLFDFFITA